MSSTNSKGISPLIAAVLLIAFTMAIAAIAGPFFSNTFKNAQGETEGDLQKVVSASKADLEISQLKYDPNSGNYTVTVQNKGSEAIENFTVTAFGDETVQTGFDKRLECSEIHTFNVPTNNSSTETELRIDAENIPVTASQDLTEIGSDSTNEVSNYEPNASFSYSPSSPVAGESISFDGSGSSDSDGSITSYEWDWTDDDSYEATGSTASHSYASSGDYTVELNVTDDAGKTDTTTSKVSVTQALAITAFSPADGASSVSTDSKFNITFNKQVVKGSGDFRLYNGSDSLVETIDVNNADPGKVLLMDNETSNDTVNIDTSSALNGSTGYYWKADADVLKDTQGNNWTGISNPDTYNFTTENLQLFTDYFDDGSISGSWSTVGDVSEHDSKLDIYNPGDCNTDEAIVDLGSQNSNISMNFGWIVDISGWYEVPKYTVTVDGSTVKSESFPKSEDGHYEGEWTRYADVNGNTQVKFWVDPSGACGAGDHYHTALLLRDLEIRKVN